MPPGSDDVPIRRLLTGPLRDRNFRQMLRYLASWQFAVNLATPFFTVYFVRELGFGMGFVLIFSFISQIANLAVIRGWGRLSDHFSNKSVLSVATPLFIFSIVAMAFASDVDGMTARSAYLVMLHIIMGAAAAGVGLASGNIVLKLSPGGAATGYLASNAIIGAIAAGMAPIIGGWASDFFAARKLTLAVRWTSPEGAAELGVMFTHWEFFFLVSAVIGLYALHRLSLVQESGFTGRREVVSHIVYSARRNLGNISSVTGLREAMSFPAGELIKLRERKMAIIQGLQERLRSSLSLSTRRQVTGWVLEAGYAVPPPDPSLDDLLDRIA